MKQQIQKIKVGRLYKIAEEIRKSITEEEDIERIDRTDDLLHELECMIKEGEIIIININAKMRLGKSTLAISIGQYIYTLLKKYKMRKEDEEFGITNIDRDQQEHSKRMRDPNTAFTVQVVDESNALEMSGENSSVEKALSDVFSSIQAGRYVSKVCCSPKDTVDPNADILISVTGMDKRNAITHAKLYYKYYEGGQEYTILLGYIRWSVAQLIQNWDKEAKQLFYKRERTPEEDRRLKYLRRKDFYVEYMFKKYEKMELLTKEGIFRPRVLDYAEVIMNVVDRLKTLTSLTSLINANIVRNYVKMECKKQKIPLSIVGEELATREVLGLLDLYKALYKLKKQKDTAKNKTTTSPTDDIETKEKIRQATDMIKEVANAIYMQEKEYQKLAEINKKYNTYETENEK